MGIMLLLLVFVLVRIRITAQQQTNVEDINNILDKLINKANETGAKVYGESPDIPEPYYPIPNEMEAGNDSNIYYFKTYMAPRIKFKSNSETLRVVHRSNKTARNVGRKYEALSEDELIPGTPKNGSIDTEEQRQLRNGPSSEKESYPLAQYKISENDKNFNMLEDLYQKEMRKKSTTEKSPYAHIPGKPLSLIHDYPELVIDHISYNNDDNDDGGTKNFGKKVRGAQSIPEGEPTTPSGVIYQEAPATQLITQENNASKTEYEEVKDIVETVIEEKDDVMQNESKKQMILLEKILEKLQEKQLDPSSPDSDSRSALPLPPPLNTLPPAEIDGISLMSGYLPNLQHNVVSGLSTSYISPILTPRRVPIVSYLPGALIAPPRKRLVTTFLHRPMARYIYRPALPVFYGLF